MALLIQAAQAALRRPYGKVRAICFVAALLIPALIPFWAKDTAQDWVILKAGWEGINVTLPVEDLANVLGIPDSESYPGLSVARPPGFFAAYTVGLPSQMGLVVFVAVLNAISVAYVSRGSVAKAAVLFLLLTESLAWVNPAAIWAGLIVLTWNHLDDEAKWGIPLGLVAAVRLWPLLPAVFLALARRRTGVGALATFGLLTAAGLAIVPLSQTVESITGSTVWFLPFLANISLSAFLYRFGVPIFLTVAVGSLLALWWARRLSVSFGYGLTVVAAVLLSPLGWPAYLSATVPKWPKGGHENPSALGEPEAFVQGKASGQG